MRHRHRSELRLYDHPNHPNISMVMVCPRCQQILTVMRRAVDEMDRRLEQLIRAGGRDPKKFRLTSIRMSEDGKKVRFLGRYLGEEMEIGNERATGPESATR